MVRKGEIVTLNLLLNILRSHGSIPSAPEPEKTIDNEIEKLLRSYNRYLVQDRGLSSSTIQYYTKFSHFFLSYCFNSESIHLNKLCTNDVIGFVLKYSSELNPARCSLMVTSLRSFLRFLYISGNTNIKWASCIPTVAGWKDNRLPQYLKSEDLEHLLEHSKGKTALQRRNYAVLILLARLGLRACEVVRLNLDDIDWMRGEIIIRGKGAKQSKFPLPIDVGEALVAYLKNDRPLCSTRRFFISSRAPIKPFGNSSTVSAIVSRSLKRAGLNPPNKGAHLFRHTLGSQALHQGANLYEVGEILRHQQIDTTAIYAKVDFVQLKTIIQPWPDISMYGGVL